MLDFKEYSAKAKMMSVAEYVAAGGSENVDHVCVNGLVEKPCLAVCDDDGSPFLGFATVVEGSNGGLYLEADWGGLSISVPFDGTGIEKVLYWLWDGFYRAEFSDAN